MKTHSKCMPAAIVLVVVSLMTAMLEPAAFARSTDEAESAAPVVLPNRPFVPEKVAMSTAVPPRQTPVPAVRTIRQPDTPLPQQSKGKSKKWIVIIAAAGAAGAAALLLRGGNDNPQYTQTPTPPTVTVGAPTVGQPQ